MFSWLLYNTLLATPIALVALAVARLPRVRPATVHILWVLVLFRLLLPALPLAVGAEGAGSPSAPAFGVIGSSPSWANELVGWTTRTFGNNWSAWIIWIGLGVFGVGFLGFLVRQVRHLFVIESRVRGGRRPSRALALKVQRVASRLGVRTPQLCSSEEVTSPFLWSPRSPLLVLPQAEADLDQTVLAHEFAHLRRRDHWAGWLELLAMAFHWWNPLYWVARRRLHFYAELACDAWVVAHYPNERQNYASALVDAVERAVMGNHAPHALRAVGMNARDIERRLRRILESGSPPQAPRAAVFGAIMLSLATLPGLAAPPLAVFRASLPGIPSGLDTEGYARMLEHAEGVLAQDPFVGPAHRERGHALMGLGRFDQAVTAFERQAECGYELGKAFYNLACAYALLSEPDLAFEALELAADEGIALAEVITLDPDLVALRDDARFAQLALR